MTAGAASARAVLVVDDDDKIRAVVRAVLEAGDFEVIEAPDGEVALRLLADIDGRRPTVVVLDVMMPGIDGVEVCRQVDHASTKVLMLTARDDPATERASREAGADGFLGKPFSAIDLLDAVEGLIQVRP